MYINFSLTPFIDQAVKLAMIPVFSLTYFFYKKLANFARLYIFRTLQHFANLVLSGNFVFCPTSKISL